MKRALVCGAGGFIASHLVKRLKKDGYWVRGVDIKNPEYSAERGRRVPRSSTCASQHNCRCGRQPAPDGATFDEVYQLAADMGGMGFIHSAECEIMRNSALINIHMTHAAADGGRQALFLLLLRLRLPRHDRRRSRR